MKTYWCVHFSPITGKYIVTEIAYEFLKGLSDDVVIFAKLENATDYAQLLNKRKSNDI